MTRNNRATIEVLFGACSKSALRGRIKIKSHPSFAGKLIGTLSITPPSSNNPPLSRTYGKSGGKSIEAKTLTLRSRKNLAAPSSTLRISYVIFEIAGGGGLLVAQVSSPD